MTDFYSKEARDIEDEATHAYYRDDNIRKSSSLSKAAERMEIKYRETHDLRGSCPVPSLAILDYL